MIEITKLARIGVLTYRDRLWIRRYTRDSFDIPIRVLDSAQSSDLIGLYLFKLHEEIQEIREGLYRDDGLFIIRKPII